MRARRPALPGAGTRHPATTAPAERGRGEAVRARRSRPDRMGESQAPLGGSAVKPTLVLRLRAELERWASGLRRTLVSRQLPTGSLAEGFSSRGAGVTVRGGDAALAPRLQIPSDATLPRPTGRLSPCRRFGLPGGSPPEDSRDLGEHLAHHGDQRLLVVASSGSSPGVDLLGPGGDADAVHGGHVEGAFEEHVPVGFELGLRTLLPEALSTGVRAA